MEKKQMIHWIFTMIRQLVQIHKCRGNPCYQYVNPYSIIVTDKGELCFLDIGADSNKEKIRLMYRRNIRENFLPEEENIYHKVSEELDIYGFGKTLQYLLNFVEVEPKFTKKEEKKLKKMISRCIETSDRKRFKKALQVQMYLQS
jgi:hypothetical protein